MGDYQVQYKSKDGVATPTSWTDFGSAVTHTDTAAAKNVVVTGLTNGTTYLFRVVRTDKTPNWIVSSGEATPDAAFENTGTSLDKVEASKVVSGQAAQICTVSSSRGVLVSLSNAAYRIDAKYTYRAGTPSVDTQTTLGTKPNATDFKDYDGVNYSTSGSKAQKLGSRSAFFGFPSPIPNSGRVVEVYIRIYNSSNTTIAEITFTI